MSGFTKVDDMIIFAIDPGPEQSGWVLYDTKDNRVLFCGIDPNVMLIEMISREAMPGRRLVLEMISHYGSGMPVGASVFETCIWMGRFMETWDKDFAMKSNPDGVASTIKRQIIKTVLCGSARAKDANVRQALLDRFGGDMKTAKGTKAAPGPLYGVKSHIWSALAVAVAFAERGGV